ncbi:MAG: ferric reductase-like transmembrane domain-containing protein [Planctomycetes bacterium]|nr:ferric reductase-like transmembrane domain-containing protein [Planctomycetota bacterium]
MSVKYAPVKWNRNKKVYDLFVAGGIVAYLAVFLAVGSAVWAGEHAISFPILLARALGTCALVMLHIALAIGPLARLDRRFLPLVYNRRHLGVATFLVGFAHAVVGVGYYHGFGLLNPLVSLLTPPDRVPFEWFGLGALAILFVMAATSHDFWQKTLGGSAWKWLHISVYPAYALLVAHVLFGALRSETNLLYPVVLGVGFVALTGLHLATGLRERRRDEAPLPSQPVRVALEVAWVDVGSVDEIPENRAKVVALPGRERVAVFRHANGISAVTNVCAHQRGPLGEGKIVDGCITCPWHGWEYRPEDGCSPPPFQEKIATHRVKVVGRRVLIDPDPLPPGTPVEPAKIEEECHAAT